MKYSEMYKALRIREKVKEYERDEDEVLIDKDRNPILKMEIGSGVSAVPTGEEVLPPYYTTSGERNYLAQMLAMPEAKAFLDQDEMEKLLECYGNDPLYPIEIPGYVKPVGEWDDDRYLAKLRFFNELMEKKKKLKRFKEFEYKLCAELCFHFVNWFSYRNRC